MAKAFTLMGEVSCDLTSVEANLALLEKRKARTKLDFDTTGANRQAAAMKHMIRDLDKSTARPKIKAEGIVQATGEVQKLDSLLKGLDKRKTSAGAGRGSSMAGGLGGDIMSLVSGFVGGFGLKEVISRSLSEATLQERMRYSVEQAWGSLGEDMIQQADALSAATGFADDEILQAQVALSELGESANASAAQINQLIAASADVAARTGIPEFRDNITAVSEAFMMGAQGAGRGLNLLGINVSGAYMQQVYAGGRLRDTWAGMSVEQREQARIAAILAQTAKLSGAAAADANEFHGQVLRVKKQFHDAAEAIGEKLIPVLSSVLGLVNRLPKGVFEGGVIAGATLSTVAVGGMMGRILGLDKLAGGLIGGIKGLIGRGAAQAATEVAAEAAGKAAAGAATKVATAAAAEAGGSIIGKAAMAGITGVGGLAAIVGAAALALGLTLRGIAAGTNAANEQTAENAKRGIELEQVLTAKRTGEGDYLNPEQARYVRHHTKWMGGKYVDLNIYGQRLTSQAQAWQDAKYGRYATVTLVDRTAGGLRAQTDTGSYEPSIH